MPSTPIRSTRRAAGTVVALALGFVCLSIPGRAQLAAGPASRGQAQPAGKDLDEAEAAGLAAAARPARLTWERIYTLAAARIGTGGRATLPDVLDPEALAASARARGVGDFAGFRRAFLDPAGTFPDPSGRAFEVLGRLEAALEARRRVTECEKLAEVVRLLSGGAPSQAQLDYTDESLGQARQKLSDELTRYRDVLDTLKVELGLAPQAPVALDPTLLAPFHETFDAAETWQQQPRRNLDDLSRLAERLPVLDDVVLGGRSLLAMSRVDVDTPEDLLRAAAREVARTAGRDRATAPPSRELRVRAAVRKLIRIARAYQSERLRFVRTLRQRNAAFDRLVAPPSTPGPKSSPLPVFDVDTRKREVGESRTRLVALWCEYQATRVPLLREMGEFPFSDWPPFIKALSPRLGQSAAVSPDADAKAIPSTPSPPAR